MRGISKAGIAIAATMLLFGSGIAGFTGQMSLTHSTENKSMTASTTLSIQPSTLQVEQTPEGWIGVKLAEASATTMNEGEPMLPYLTHTMTFPLGTRITDVRVTVGDVTTRQLDAPVAPAATPTPYNMQQAEQVQQTGPAYDSNTVYPDTWIQWNTRVGLHQDEHMIFLTLQAFPARYTPQDNVLHLVDHIDVDVAYEPPAAPMLTADEYDLLIITPEAFTDALQPLVQHKEDHGLATRLVTLDEVYTSAEGRDEAEQIKYYIKDALEDWGITYVMLVGGRHGGLLEEQWWCPVRYTHLNANDGDKRFLSDLYFSDIYRYDNGSAVFESWDTNDNDLFGEWSFSGTDELDMFPDVYIGRLACRNVYEVNVMVDKIITYETTAAGSDWANRYLGIGGDTFPGDQWYDGEETVSKTIEYLEPLGIEPTTLFTSDETLADGQDIIDAVSQGYGFLNFEGHGNPMSWANHPPQDGNTWIGIDETQFMLFGNEGMYPVCVIGGCSNSKFNISLLNLLKFSHLDAVIAHSDYGPESFGWWIVRATDKGAIASIGCTSYGYGKSGDSDDDGIFDGIQYRGGFIDIEFFRVYAQEGKDMLGAAHGTAITNFLVKFPPMSNQIDGKTVEGWVLLGDPSLKIGGYQ
ncbi:MAG: hypothetical protein KGY55_03140 [Candidatus Thermoplasmatota archaeon]|nr:hypothetical protein [Candidatus Thermoplasmatota archaeon]